MSFWKAAKVAGGVVRGSARAGNNMGGAMSDAMAARNVSRLPRNVQRRGYLIAGDDAPPAGANLLDYRGVLPYRAASSMSAQGGDSVALGALIDLDSNAPGKEFALPVQQFCQHMCVIAPPGKGKTYGVIAPLTIRLLRAGASVVVLDVTGDLPEQISAFAREVPASQPTRVRQRHWSIHPQRGTHSWNPLAGLTVDDTIGLEGVKAAVIGDQPADPRHMDFHDRDLRMFGGVLSIALSTNRNATLTDVAELALSPERLRQAARSAPRHVGASVADLLGDDAEGLWTLRNKLEPFLDPSVRSATDHSDFTLDDVIEEHGLLIVGAELELRQRSRVSAALMVNRLVARLQGRYGASGRPVIFVLDEAPVLAERIDLTSILATARGAGAGVVLAAQHVTQFGDEGQRSALLDSCDTMVVLQGAADPTVKMFQARLGQRETPRVSVSQDVRGGFNRNVRTDRSSEIVDMIGAREMIDPPFGKYPAFVHSRTLGSSPIALELARGVLPR